MGIAERIEKLEQLHMPISKSVPHIVVFRGLPVRRLRCARHVWDRRENESESDFIGRVVVEADMGPGHWVFIAEGTRAARI